MIFIFLEYNLLTISLKYGMTLFKGVHRRGGMGAVTPRHVKGALPPPLELRAFTLFKS